MKTPVLPTPALQEGWNYRDSFQQRLSRVEGDADGEVRYSYILSFFVLAGDSFYFF